MCYVPTCNSYMCKNIHARKRRKKTIWRKPFISFDNAMEKNPIRVKEMQTDYVLHALRRE